MASANGTRTAWAQYRTATTSTPPANDNQSFTNFNVLSTVALRFSTIVANRPTNGCPQLHSPQPNRRLSTSAAYLVEWRITRESSGSKQMDTTTLLVIVLV